jgi:hypothetical protein
MIYVISATNHFSDTLSINPRLYESIHPSITRTPVFRNACRQYPLWEGAVVIAVTVVLALLVALVSSEE